MLDPPFHLNPLPQASFSHEQNWKNSWNMVGTYMPVKAVFNDPKTFHAGKIKLYIGRVSEVFSQIKIRRIFQLSVALKLISWFFIGYFVCISTNIWNIILLRYLSKIMHCLIPLLRLKSTVPSFGFAWAELKKLAEMVGTYCP